MGFEEWRGLGLEVADLVAARNETYGNSIGKSAEILAVIWPDGIPPEAIPWAHYVIRIVDKLNRIAAAPEKLEVVRDAFVDIAGYGLCALSDLDDGEA